MLKKQMSIVPIKLGCMITLPQDSREKTKVEYYWNQIFKSELSIPEF